jgi:hypothetical protein
MNQAEIEAMVDARVAAALAPKPVPLPECRNTQVKYIVGGIHECWTKEKALECAYELARRRGLPVVAFYPWNAGDPAVMVPAITIRQRLTGSWRSGYDSKSNHPIREWIFSNPINQELAKDAGDGVLHTDVPQEGDD